MVVGGLALRLQLSRLMRERVLLLVGLLLLWWRRLLVLMMLLMLLLLLVLLLLLLRELLGTRRWVESALWHINVARRRRR